jgi:MFS family permease
MLVSGPLTDRYGRKPFLIAALVLIAIMTFALPFTSDPLALTIVLMATGFSIGLSGPVAAWLTDITEPPDLGGAMGLFRTMGDLGFVIAPILLASLAGEPGEAVGLAPFLVAGLAIVLLTLPLLWTPDPVAEERRMGLQD